MLKSLQKTIKIIAFGLLILAGCVLPMMNQTIASNAPQYGKDYADDLMKGQDKWVIDPSSRFQVSKDKTLKENIVALFYPSTSGGGNAIYQVIKDMTLGVMIVFFVWAGASILFDRKPEEVKKTLRSLVYILIGGVFVYGANWIFGDVLDFKGGDFTVGNGMKGIEDATHKVFFVVLSALKAFAFFLSIIMLVITGFRVIAAGEGEKGKKLVKGLINVVIGLLIIKGIDFVYYIAADAKHFVSNAAELIINIAKIFAYIYGVITVIMVIVAGYLYMTDGGSGNNFKKATNVLVNILLSALVLFAFLLILYQIFAEFQKGGDAVESQAFIMTARNLV